jgi:hypothetical protein
MCQSQLSFIPFAISVLVQYDDMYPYSTLARHERLKFTYLARFTEPNPYPVQLNITFG